MPSLRRFRRPLLHAQHTITLDCEGMDLESSENSERLVRWGAVAGAALGALVFLVGCAAFFGFTADDAFIVVRYAYNLVTRGELAFNPGERVSALTSPLHALLTTGVLAVVGLGSVEVANKCLGMFAVLASVGFAGVSTLNRESQRVLFWVGTLASPFVWLWTVGGLETPYLLASVTTVAALHVRAMRTASPSSLWAMAAATAFGLLLRLDACLFLAPLWVASSLRYRWQIARPAALVVVLVGAWYAFAAFYFHDVFPTSFYVKLFHKPKPLADNVSYSLQFLLLSGVAIVSLVTISSWRTRETSRANSPERDGQWALCFGLGFVFVYSLTHSAQHMFFAFRLFVPYVPATFLVLAGWRSLHGWRLLLGVGSTLLGQAVLAHQMFSRGMSPTLSMLVSEEHSEEYDDVSLLEYMEFVAALDRSAEPVRRHWQAHAPSLEQPRLAVYTGGTPPVRLPEFTVLEELVSYRKECEPNFFLQAHYAQILRIAERDEDRRTAFAELAVERTGRLPEVVSREVFFFNGHPFVAEILFNANPLPMTLPTYVGDPCSP